MRATGCIAPGPADGDAGVIEVENVVVLDGVIGRVADPDADGGRMQAAAVGDDVVGDSLVAGDEVGILFETGEADFDAASAQVAERAILDAIVLAGGGKVDGVGADVADGAFLD